MTPTRQPGIGARWAEMAEELAGVGYWRMEVMTGQITWSPNMFRIMGFEVGDEPPLAEAMSRVHPEDRRAADSNLKRNLAGKTAFSMTRMVWPTGEVRHLEGRNACEYDEEGRVIAVLGTVLDVTERVHLQETIAASEQHFRALAEACPDIITRSGADGRFTYVSPAVRTVLGYQPLEALGKTAFDFMHIEDVVRVRARMKAHIKKPDSARAFHLSCRLVHKRGHIVWVESHPKLIRDPATGRVTEVQDIIRDVSEKKRRLRLVA